MASSATAGRILDSAERLLQVRGFNAFSYADISRELGIRKASIHYHFPTKTDLGRRLVERYREAFRARLEEIDRRARDAAEKLRRYAGLYRGVLAEDRMCLCGMLASDYVTLPKAVREEVKRFFDESGAWLLGVLAGARRAGRLRFEGAPETAARLFVAGLEGAMLIARCYADLGRFDAVARRLLAELGVRP